MIGSLRGEVLERWAEGTVLVDVAGVGYEVIVSPRTFGELEPTTSAFLYIHHHIREDDQTLYGFLTRDERSTFKTLIATHGVGPALAMAILATYPPAALVDVVDQGRLRRAQGGPRGRPEDGPAADRRAARPAVRSGARRRPPAAMRRAAPTVGAVMEALAGLGYGADEIRDAVRELSGEATATPRRCCATRSSCSEPSVRDEFLDPGINDDADEAVEAGLRPRRLAEFVGQSELKEHLAIVLEAARRRRQAVDHLLFAGPPGLGKTTLATIVAAEMDVQLHITSGPALERAGDLAAILTKLGDHDVLFVDEIHRLSRAVEEILYPAMEDFQLDIVVGKGPAASSIRLSLQPFTLVGATTRTGMITGPLRDRFGLVARLDYYAAEELAGDRRARRRHPRREHRRGRGVGDRPAGPWYAADRQPSAASRARLRRGPRRRSHRRRHRRTRPHRVRRRRARPRQGRPVRARRVVPAVRRGTGRALHAGDRRGRADRDGRGRLRAVPDPAGADRPHATWPGGDAGGVHAPRPGAAQAGRRPPDLFG